MGVNLMDLIKDQLTTAAIGQVGKMVGLGEKETSSALGGVIPAILGGLVKQASTPSGLGHVARALDEANDTLLDDVLGFLGGDKSQMFDIGGKVLKGLFGSREEKVTHAVGRSTGISASTIGSLLKIAAPLVLSFLARHKKQAKMDERGFGDLLNAQKPYLKKVLPPEVGGALGFDEAVAAVKPSGGLGRFLPLIIIAALAFFAWKMFFNKAPQPEPQPTPAVVKPTDLMADALVRVENAFAGVKTLSDVQQAVPVLMGATDDLEALIGSVGAYSSEEKQTLGQVAKMLTPRLEKWIEPVAKIPGAAKVLEPALISFGKVIDTIASWVR